mmetsp:Transcript_41030/g.132972  ORF Transcript_41030/g.132972 Transcript_41030/m.132972 type:complete len:148 (-) Transcript_41030:368-811(-)
MGLAREDSHTGYRAALLDDLRRVPRGDSVVLKFGQVDCDFVYYLKLVHDASLTFEAHLARSVERYFAFIDGALAAGHLRAQARGATAPEAPCSPRSPLPRLPTAGLPWCASGPVHRHALPDGRGGRPPAGGALLAAAHGKGGARGVP